MYVGRGVKNGSNGLPNPAKSSAYDISSLSLILNIYEKHFQHSEEVAREFGSMQEPGLPGRFHRHHGQAR